MFLPHNIYDFNIILHTEVFSGPREVCSGIICLLTSTFSFCLTVYFSGVTPVRMVFKEKPMVIAAPSFNTGWELFLNPTMSI